MSRTKLDLSKIRIASPCPVSWESMTGDEKVRHCDACGLNVNNFAAMTEREIAEVIGQSNGRVCARLYRRADGTIMTSDCPRGLSAVRKRIAMVAGAALTAVLSLFTVTFGQTNQNEAMIADPRSRGESKDTAKLVGTVRDSNDAVVPGVRITLRDPSGKTVRSTKSDGEGMFEVSGVKPGLYVLEAVRDGFKTTRITGLKLVAGGDLSVDVGLLSGEVLMGIVDLADPDASAASGTTTFTVRDN